MKPREMVLDVVEPFCPGLQSILFEVDKLYAEPTSKSHLNIATHTTTINPILDEFNIRNVMFLLPVISERSKFFLVAAPLFQVEMLRIFMSLPIILEVKCLIKLQFKKVQPYGGFLFSSISLQYHWRSEEYYKLERKSRRQENTLEKV